MVFTFAGSAAVLSRVGPEVVDVTPVQRERQTGPSSTETTSTTRPFTTTTTEQPDIPPCSGPARPARGDPVADWSTIVVDPTRKLPEGFQPPDLQWVSLEGSQGNIQVRELVVPDLAAMLQAAYDHGTPLTLVSGYRSGDRQAALYAEHIHEVGEDAAGETLAKPGHSEHQLGTTVDVLAPGMVELTAEFGDTPAGLWLAENAHRYGFVVSYPKGTRDRSCYAYEPWHIRYVGRDTAREIHESDLTPREWMLSQRS